MKDNNIMLSELSDSGVEDVILEAIRIDDVYERRIGLSNNITFGLEIEFESALQDEVRDVIDNYSGWQLVNDISVVSSFGGIKYGGEVNSPVLKDNHKTWVVLKRICDDLKFHEATVGRSGGHIHFGTQILDGNVNTWTNFIKLWGIYERVIFKFGYGKSGHYRPTIEYFATPYTYGGDAIFNEIFRAKGRKNYSFNTITEGLKDEVYGAFYLGNVTSPNDFMVGNTIEIRCPNGSLDPYTWQNNVNFFAHFLEATKGKFDNDKIFDRTEMVKFRTGMRRFDRIYLNDALELCDIVYDNTKDKLKFLKQYLQKASLPKDKEIFELVKKRGTMYGVPR